MNLADIDKLLTTTRSVRKRLDYSRPVPPELIQECIEIAIQAPTGSNLQGWGFLVVTDPAKKKAIADIYRKAWDIYVKMPRPERAASDLREQQLPRVVDSAAYLAETLHQAPAFVIACVEGRVETAPQFMQASIYGSILPAAWSFMLAARARGLGAAWTTLHLMQEAEAAAILGIPQNITQAVLMPVAYYTGEDFKPAERVPAREITYWDTWGAKR